MDHQEEPQSRVIKTKNSLPPNPGSIMQPSALPYSSSPPPVLSKNPKAHGLSRQHIAGIDQLANLKIKRQYSRGGSSVEGGDIEEETGMDVDKPSRGEEKIYQDEGSGDEDELYEDEDDEEDYDMDVDPSFSSNGKGKKKGSGEKGKGKGKAGRGSLANRENATPEVEGLTGSSFGGMSSIGIIDQIPKKPLNPPQVPMWNRDDAGNPLIAEGKRFNTPWNLGFLGLEGVEIAPRLQVARNGHTLEMLAREDAAATPPDLSRKGKGKGPPKE